MSDYEKKIERGLILWLREEKGITAISASIGESEIERGWSSGCDTCGYGADEDKVTTPVYYKTSSDKWNSSIEIEGTSINFLPTLLEYIERAN